jgi:xanthine dehydrogenase accessory factor
MDSNNAALSEFFRQRRDRREALVLATIVQTAGSTYRKAGAHMLIGADGDAAGLLSGGCLESDLLDRARRVLRTRTAEIASYDTRSSDDILWGIGLGCEGAMNILLSPLHEDQGYQPFSFIEATRAAHATALYALVTEPSAVLSLGQAFQVSADGRRLRAFVGPAEFELESSELSALPQRTLTFPAALPVTATVRLGDARLLVLPIALPLRVLILGAGPDVQPLVHMGTLLGWRVTVVDHRAAYATPERFPSAARVVLGPATELDSRVKLSDFDAAIVMSHHLPSDETYLRILSASALPYVGLLGPAPRRARLLAELGSLAQNLAGRLRGPVGLDIGANTPETIALAIVSEIQAVLSGRSGRPFSETA